MISHEHKIADLSWLKRENLRIAVISDTHGFVDARIIKVVSTCNVVIHAGDIGAASVIQALEPVDGQIFAVTGNNDVESKWPNSDRCVLASLPSSYEILLPVGTIAVEHGHRVFGARRDHEALRQKFSGCQAVIYGHTHVRVIDDSRLPWVINPGAAGRIRTRGGSSCCVIEVNQQQWSIEEIVFDLLSENRSVTRMRSLQ